MRRYLLLICLALPAVLPAVTLHVPAQYPTIQTGITAAADGDTVLVAPGIYTETINFQGREIVVKSELGADSTKIIWAGQQNVVTFNHNEASGAVLEGFTIRNDYPAMFAGVGVVCSTGTAPVIRNNKMRRSLESIRRRPLYCRRFAPHRIQPDL
jgi:hypothetical protein